MSNIPVTRRSFMAAAAAASVVGRRPAIAQGAMLRVAQPWEFRTLEPSENGSTFARASIAEFLVLSEPDGTMVPGLADRWQVAEDGLTWRFHIRDNAKFHDGTKVTAELAKASMERLIPRSTYLRGTGITSIAAQGQDLTITLAAPFGPFLEYAVDYTVPILAPSSFNAAGNVVAMIGTGPFRIARADLPRSLDLAAFADYWGPAPGVRGVRFDGVANGDTRANMALAGDADLVLNLPTPAIQRLAGASAMRVERVVIPRTHYVMLNAALPQFAAVETRRALAMAIDRVGIATSIMRNPALAATQYVAPSLPRWHAADAAPLALDVAGANALLDRAGWARGSDGMRAKDGVRFAGTMRTFPNRAELPVIATALQAQFRAVGFELQIAVGDFAAIAQAQRENALELALNSRNLVLMPDPISTIAMDFTRDDTNREGGAVNWRHQGLRDAVAAYMRTAAEPARAPLRATIVKAIHDELPIIPVVWFEQVVGVGAHVNGYVLDPFEQRIGLQRISLRG